MDYKQVNKPIGTSFMFFWFIKQIIYELLDNTSDFHYFYKIQNQLWNQHEDQICPVLVIRECLLPVSWFKVENQTTTQVWGWKMDFTFSIMFIIQTKCVMFWENISDLICLPPPPLSMVPRHKSYTFGT